MIPYVGAFAVGLGANIIDNALGRPMELWTRQIQVGETPYIRDAQLRANRGIPNVLPSPEALIAAKRRGLLNPNTADDALAMHGIATDGGERHVIEFMPIDNYDWYKRVWKDVGLLNQSRPDISSVINAAVRLRLDPDTFALASAHLDVDWNRYTAIARSQYNMPGENDLWQLWQRGNISSADYYLWMARLGWFETEARELRHQVTVLPTLQEAMLAFWRRDMNQDEWSRYVLAAGYTDSRVMNDILLANKPMPSPSDLVRFAVREVWDDGVVQRWGYDAEFPQPFQKWMRWWGMDWGQQFALPNGQQAPLVTWPQAYWRAHWQPMPLSYSYQAYNRFRPDRIARFQARFPGMEAFTAQYLDDVIKVADYPPKVRAWLAALNSPVLRQQQIGYAFRYNLRDGNWAAQQWRDRGYLDDDIQALQDIEIERNRREEFGGVIRLIRNNRVALIRETLEGYREGISPRADAMIYLNGQGFTQQEATRQLDLIDLQEDRRTIQQTVKLIQRGFLNGSFNYQETVGNLRSSGLSGPRVEQLLRRWQAQRSLTRRALATSNITRMVADGALLPAIALQRLVNLGWFVPDAQALVGEAELKYTAMVARIANAQARAQDRRQRAQLQALKTGQAAVRSAQSQLRRITPIATLRSWLLRGIRSAPWTRQRMSAIGFDTASIDAYLSLWVKEQQDKQPAVAPSYRNLESLYKRQTPISTVKRWFQRGIISESWARARLALMGYVAQSIEGYIREWYDTLTSKQPGPAADTGAPQANPLPRPAEGTATVNVLQHTVGGIPEGPATS